jgi:hypothetical protein
VLVASDRLALDAALQALSEWSAQAMKRCLCLLVHSLLVWLLAVHSQQVQKERLKRGQGYAWGLSPFESPLSALFPSLCHQFFV